MITFNYLNKGKSAVVEVAQNVIRLIRQKCFIKGLISMDEKLARGISESEEEQRFFNASIDYTKYRLFYQQRKGKIDEDERLKIYSEIQTGNSGEMSYMAFIMLKRMAPPGIKIDMHQITVPKTSLMHIFVSVKPKDSTNESDTLIIDATPSNQISMPEVVSNQDYVYGEQKSKISQSYSNPAFEFEKEKILNYDRLRMKEFNLEAFRNIEKDIEEKNYLYEPLWNSLRNYRENINIEDYKKNKQAWRQLVEKRRYFPSIFKTKPLD